MAIVLYSRDAISTEKLDKIIRQAVENNYKIPPRQKKIAAHRVVQSLNSTFTSEVLSASGVCARQVKEQRVPDVLRSGIPRNGMRRTMKPSITGKNFALSGEMLSLQRRPTPHKKKLLEALFPRYAPTFGMQGGHMYIE